MSKFLADDSKDRLFQSAAKVLLGLTLCQTVCTWTFHSDSLTLVNKGQTNEIKCSARRGHKMSAFIRELIIHHGCSED